jgi:hypothetical protein
MSITIKNNFMIYPTFLLVLKVAIGLKQPFTVERAWLVVSANHAIQFSGPVAIDIQLDNLGITEARKLVANDLDCRAYGREHRN